MIRHLGFRRWTAWKLVELAHKIYDPEYYQRIFITDSQGKEVFWAKIVCDTYGRGVSSLFMDNRDGLLAGCVVHWDDDYIPDWIEE